MTDPKKHEGISEGKSAEQKPDEKKQGSVKKGGEGGRGEVPGQRSSYRDRDPGEAPANERERPRTGLDKDDEESERNRDRTRASETGQGGRSS